MEETSVSKRVPDQLRLARERTFLAHERTLMAWIRTAVSLITLGFTLFKFFQYLNERDPHGFRQHLLGARTMGMLMITIGITTLALATWQHRRSLIRLRAHHPDTPFSLALLIAALIAALGILALMATIFRG